MMAIHSTHNPTHTHSEYTRGGRNTRVNFERTSRTKHGRSEDEARKNSKGRYKGMKTSKDKIAERRQRIAEYETIRKTLFGIVTSETASDSDKIKAAAAIAKLDTEGVPMPNEWDF